MQPVSSSPSETEQSREQRRRKLRKELLLLLKRLRKACARFRQVEQWAEYAARAIEIADRYVDVLSDADRQRLKEATQLKDHSLSAVHAACQVLEFEIERILATLPAAVGGAVLGTAIKALLVVSVVAGVAVGALNLSRPASVRFENLGCGPIPIAEAMPSAVAGLVRGLGVGLPARLDDGQVAEVTVPSLFPDLTLDARHPPTLQLRAPFVSIPFQVSNALNDIRLNGHSVLGQQAPIPLRAGNQVQIQVICP